jgi:hypothetical protein
VQFLDQGAQVKQLFSALSRAPGGQELFLCQQSMYALCQIRGQAFFRGTHKVQGSPRLGRVCVCGEGAQRSHAKASDRLLPQCCQRALWIHVLAQGEEGELCFSENANG